MFKTDFDLCLPPPLYASRFVAALCLDKVAYSFVGALTNRGTEPDGATLFVGGTVMVGKSGRECLTSAVFLEGYGTIAERLDEKAEC